MSSDPTQLTSEEIQQYRQKFQEHPEALDALFLIKECNGDLEKSVNFLVVEEGRSELRSDDSEEEKTLDKIANQFRQILCEDVFIDDLMGGLVGAAIGSLAATGQIPAAVATPVVIYLAKKGIKTWCDTN